MTDYEETWIKFDLFEIINCGRTNFGKDKWPATPQLTEWPYKLVIDVNKLL